MKQKVIGLKETKSFPWLGDQVPSIGLIYSEKSKLHHVPEIICQLANQFQVEVILNKPLGTLTNAVIGGDGTNMGVVRMLKDLKVPIFAVKGGTANAAPLVDADKAYHTFKSFLEGNYELSQRNLLNANLPFKQYKTDLYGQPIYKYQPTLGTVPVRIINEIKIEYIGDSPLRININGTDLPSFRANGILMTTALGSTAENKGHFGEILPHNDPKFVVTPIAAYTSLSQKDRLEFYSTAISIDEPIEISIEYLRKRSHINLGFVVRIDNLTPVFFPRTSHRKIIDNTKIRLTQDDPWYLVEPIKLVNK